MAGVAALIVQSMPDGRRLLDVWTTIEQASTKGVIEPLLGECCGDPDKLLFVPADATPPPPAAALDLATVQPARLYDSRSGPGPRPAGSITEIPGRWRRRGAGRRAAGRRQNVTAVEPEAPGYFTLFPCGSGLPNASNLNFRAGRDDPERGGRAHRRRWPGVRVHLGDLRAAGRRQRLCAGRLPRSAGSDPFRLFDSWPAGAAAAPPARSPRYRSPGACGVPTRPRPGAPQRDRGRRRLPDGYMTLFPCGTTRRTCPTSTSGRADRRPTPCSGESERAGRSACSHRRTAGCHRRRERGGPTGDHRRRGRSGALTHSRQLGGPACCRFDHRGAGRRPRRCARSRCDDRGLTHRARGG